jgi:tetratricopeptide (TPR) repeat protein
MAAIVTASLLWWQQPRKEQLLTAAHKALDSGQFDEAEKLAQEWLSAYGDVAEPLIIAAEASMGAGRSEDARQYLSRLPDEPLDQAIRGHRMAASLNLQDGHADGAEHHLRKVLKLRPQLPSAVRSLARLLSVEGRLWEAEPLLTGLVNREQHSLEDLLMLGRSDEDFIAEDEVARLITANPECTLPLISSARTAFREQKFDLADELLDRVLLLRPEMTEALAWKGWTLLYRQEFEQLAEWQAKLPHVADSHPLIWVVRGDWASESGDTQGAMRCYWEALQRNANNLQSNYRLAQLLTGDGQPDAGKLFQERAQLLRQLNTIHQEVWANRNNPQLLQSPRGLEALRKAAELNEALGRLPEATAFYAVLAKAQPRSTTYRTKYATLRIQTAEMKVRTIRSANPALQIDLSSCEFPRARSNTTPEIAHQKQRSSVSPVKFDNQAVAVGIEFSYFNDHDYDDLTALNGMPIYQANGGGVGSLDIDRDGWPDLIFTQGCEWPATTGGTAYRDCLYRNTGRNQFRNVTQLCGLIESGFGQGVSAGDFDNDGFPDLYIANLGDNCLLHNNGDGTFSAVADPPAADAFTNSCMIADVNGDSVPDLYDVNYVLRRGIEDLCKTTEGPSRGCAPKNYQAAQDRLCLGSGSGRFTDITSDSGIEIPDGYGMGIVAGNLDDSGSVSLFVSNDGRPNFWFKNESQPGDSPRFANRAVTAGVGVSGNGMSQACMGIAAGDVDGDGHVDLFVTNYYEEHNTLYGQQASGQFVDASNTSGLAKPSMAFVGFGTQLIDADLDGWRDVIVSNGHVDDFRYRNIPFTMAPLLFRNMGDGVFSEELPTALGPYGAGAYLGRGMARLDWNRDGREDVIITHIQQPAALLTNQSVHVGHFLSIELVGTNASRDAIGCTVRVTAAGRQHVQQVIAGDGYQASNQRRLIFGLGTASVIDELVVTWPSKVSQIFTQPPTDRELVVIEGRSEVLLVKP